MTWTTHWGGSDGYPQFARGYVRLLAPTIQIVLRGEIIASRLDDVFAGSSLRGSAQDGDPLCEEGGGSDSPVNL